ncbi:hypothetical protein BCR43DRAFT_510830 [Syncephalastrum racemosum]|uniref:Uncharacterized protein n=1 Tax=Syncephalastrum racemosum TaxID=13706 RepID=A0A1X2HW35_SYNRA|nr:hypothetical protein BCR43DRAFT_510830 [Syncephalastrum racemosum]
MTSTNQNDGESSHSFTAQPQENTLPLPAPPPDYQHALPPPPYMPTCSPPSAESLDIHQFWSTAVNRQRYSVDSTTEYGVEKGGRNPIKRVRWCIASWSTALRRDQRLACCGCFTVCFMVALAVIFITVFAVLPLHVNDSIKKGIGNPSMTGPKR